MTRVGVITQARTTSTRLPGKILLPAGGRSLLEHHVDRLAAGGLAVYLATTANTADDPVAELADQRGWPCFRGDEYDVLGRFAACAAAFDLDLVVRATSDCPLIDGALVAGGVDRFVSRDDPWLYLSNTVRRTYPRGFDFEVFSAQALAAAAELATEPWQREHVTPYLWSGADPRVTVEQVVRGADASAYRLTVDTAADYRLLRRLIEDHGAAGLDAEAIIALLDRHPELAAINAAVAQKPVHQVAAPAAGRPAERPG
ncbi:MAG: glycosyltransferase family protein [Propionibacteriaceae bacterium]|nr:glycosyltransferase family protein [Propionibacteriaceae bacterium]